MTWFAKGPCSCDHRLRFDQQDDVIGEIDVVRGKRL